MGGGSLGGMADPCAWRHDPGIVHIDQPHWYAEGGDMTPEEFGLMRAQALEARSLNWASTRSPPSSANRCRARAA
jgi:putrescine---pyruvate transaminase